MNPSLLPLGEQVPGQPVPVLNERAVRAGAGLLFLFAMMPKLIRRIVISPPKGEKTWWDF
jgi:hypothetical protein